MILGFKISCIIRSYNINKIKIIFHKIYRSWDATTISYFNS